MQRDPQVQEYLRARSDQGGGSSFGLSADEERIPGAVAAARAQQAARDGLLGDLDGLAQLGIQTRRIPATN